MQSLPDFSCNILPGGKAKSRKANPEFQESYFITTWRPHAGRGSSTYDKRPMPPGRRVRGCRLHWSILRGSCDGHRSIASCKGLHSKPPVGPRGGDKSHGWLPPSLIPPLKHKQTNKQDPFLLLRPSQTMRSTARSNARSNANKQRQQQFTTFALVGVHV